MIIIVLLFHISNTDRHKFRNLNQTIVATNHLKIMSQTKYLFPYYLFFFFNDPPTTEIYPLPLPAPLPISLRDELRERPLDANPHSFDGRDVIARAVHERDVVPGTREVRADGPADRSGAPYQELHGISQIGRAHV